MATHSSVLARRIPGTAEPGGLPSMGSRRVGHDWSDLAAANNYREKTNEFGFPHTQKVDKIWQNVLHSPSLSPTLVIWNCRLNWPSFTLFFCFIFFLSSTLDESCLKISVSKDRTTLLIVSFAVQKLLSFIRSHLFIFAFVSNILGCGS